MKFRTALLAAVTAMTISVSANAQEVCSCADNDNVQGLPAFTAASLADAFGQFDSFQCTIFKVQGTYIAITAGEYNGSGNWLDVRTQSGNKCLATRRDEGEQGASYSEDVETQPDYAQCNQTLLNFCADNGALVKAAQP